MTVSTKVLSVGKRDLMVFVILIMWLRGVVKITNPLKEQIEV